MTFDADGTQHEQISGVTKLLRQDFVNKERLDKVMIEFRESLRTLRASDYLSDILEETERIAADAVADLTPKQVIDSVVKGPSAQTGKAWVCLDISRPADMAPLVHKYQRSFEKRGEYTVGTQRLLRKIERKAVPQVSRETPSPLKKPSEYESSPRNSTLKKSGAGTQRQARESRVRRDMRNTFATSRSERDQLQSDHLTMNVAKSNAYRKRFRSAITSVIKKISHEKVTLKSADAEYVHYSPKRPDGAPRTQRRFRRHTNGSGRSGSCSNGPAREASIMGLVAKSNITRRNVSCGQEMDSMKNLSRKVQSSLHDTIASDLRLDKQMWSIHSRTRGAGGGQAKPVGLSSGRKGRKSRRRGGSFLMLANPHGQDMRSRMMSGGPSSLHANTKSRLPDNKHHWLTIKAGPSSRAAALQTERLQRTEAARKAKTGVDGIATGQHAAAAQMIRMRAWKKMITKLRFSGGKKFAFDKDKMRSQVEDTISATESTLKKWQNGFQKLDRNYADRLKNALLVRELHRKEMNTGEHIGYILKRVENESAKRKPNGSEILEPDDRTAAGLVARAALSNDKSAANGTVRSKTDNLDKDWAPDRMAVPKIIQKGPLTSFWTDARNERITRAEVKSLGGKMVNFWQTFCLLRASLPGPVAPGELEVCHKLKNLLEDGQVVTEQVVHDIMMLFPEDLIQSNKRVKALVALLQRTAEDVDVENVMTF